MQGQDIHTHVVLVRGGGGELWRVDEVSGVNGTGSDGFYPPSRSVSFVSS